MHISIFADQIDRLMCSIINVIKLSKILYQELIMGLQCLLCLETENNSRLIFLGRSSTNCKELADILKINAYGNPDPDDPAEHIPIYINPEDIDYIKLADFLVWPEGIGEIPFWINQDEILSKEQVDVILAAVSNCSARLEYTTSY